MAGTYHRQITGDINVEANVFNGKTLTEIGRDIYVLMWPFFAMSALVLALYVTSIVTFSGVNNHNTNLKLMYRVQVCGCVDVWATGPCPLLPRIRIRISICMLVVAVRTDQTFFQTWH